jgi:hypothetical protein
MQASQVLACAADCVGVALEYIQNFLLSVVYYVLPFHTEQSGKQTEQALL